MIPSFEQFIMERVEQYPGEAGANMALLDLHRKGFLNVVYNDELKDFNLYISKAGEAEFLAQSAIALFEPAEA